METREDESWNTEYFKPKSIEGYNLGVRES